MTNLCFYLAAPEPPIFSLSTGLDSVPDRANVEAASGVVLVLLVPTNQHIGKAGLAHPRSAHDQNAGARKPDNIKS